MRRLNVQAALSFAAMKVRNMVVKTLLLNQDIDLESGDRDDRTRLSWTVKGENVRVVTLVLDKSTLIESNNKHSWALISRAAGRGRRHGPDC
jgi:hypothetical protein